VLERAKPHSADDLGGRIRIVWQGAEYRGRGRETTWDGYARLLGNRITECLAINFHNPSRLPEQRGETDVSWRSSTTGGFAGVELRLADRAAGKLAIHTPHVDTVLAVDAIGLEDTVFETGGLERRLRVYRLPDENACRSIELTRDLDVSAPGEHPLYVCLTLEDGHRAWSSPTYVCAGRQSVGATHRRTG